MGAVASHIVGQKLRGRRRYPLVLMLEPLFRCNLSCAGCGKIQYPAHILKKELSPEECFRAAAECGAPVVSLPGGEPLLHPRIDEIVGGLIERKKYVYLCTNALLLQTKLDLFRPSKYLTISVHLDGLKEEHDFAVCREGVFDVAYEAIRLALDRGFRVAVNTTLYEGADPERVRAFFDEMARLGIEGMMVSPGYSYSKAPDQDHFLHRTLTHRLFSQILRSAPRRWRFNQSPLFLEFLTGARDYPCTPWGSPTYNVFGWQRPCYLLQDGYAETFQDLLESTDWDRYGRGRDDRCADCMVHCGYEPSAVEDTFSGIRGVLATLRVMLLGARIPQEVNRSAGDGGTGLPPAGEDVKAAPVGGVETPVSSESAERFQRRAEEVKSVSPGEE
jgi:hopanoid biosynthesis associated radical SAM protein HpnH